jgi:tRNA threonylcarbamoyladenosine biosynthesis protein TsaB
MLLAIDTSTHTIGVALYNGYQVLSEMVWVNQDYHTGELAPALESMLHRCNPVDNPIQAVAVALGPGSFTGLRVGLAFVKGIVLANHIPLVGIPTLDIVAAAQPILDVPLLTILRAGRGRLAVGWYESDNRIWRSTGKVEVLSFTDLNQRIEQPTLVSGELTEEERRQLSRKWKNVILASPAACVRRPAYLAELGWERWQAGQIDDPVSISPIYLHYDQPIPG